MARISPMSFGRPYDPAIGYRSTEADLADFYMPSYTPLFLQAR